ncbi:hypothetical protein HK104_008076 [Borealophlyctis nickersoniae]|nr:hypothetical protein HK104_008076 [Borealophlyctis nickersoniae]
MTGHFIDAQPYAWPFDGNFSSKNTALIIIDMQNDFCSPGGYIDGQGISLDPIRNIIPAIQNVLAAARQHGFYVIHTREGHRKDLSDLPENKQWRSRNVGNGVGIGDAGPLGKLLVRGDEGWEIIPELAPINGEVIIDKPGKGSFYATDLDMILTLKGIKNIAIAGVTTDVCVHTTMREANDRGYECVLLTDCTAAAFHKYWEAAIRMIHMQGGVFGATTTADKLIEEMSKFAAPSGKD